MNNAHELDIEVEPIAVTFGKQGSAELSGGWPPRRSLLGIDRRTDSRSSQVAPSSFELHTGRISSNDRWKARAHPWLEFVEHR